MVVDPGASAMQPNYPLSDDEKMKLRSRAIGKIVEAVSRSKAVIVTHYHFDHYLTEDKADLSVYLGKRLILKDPNRYINESQRKRADQLLTSIARSAGVEPKFQDPSEDEFPDPVSELVEATSRNFGDYSERRKELLLKGKRWFSALSKKWSSWPWFSELHSKGLSIEWGDRRKFELGDVTVNVYPPWFHGVEYDRTGWVIPLEISYRGRKIFYTSDLMGPMIEDYATKICDLRPDILIADGPPTYLFPFMLNKINLRRAVDNMVQILREASPEVVVYDHHLLREKRWRLRVSEVFKTAEREGVILVTVAEAVGSKPLIDSL